MMPSGTKGTIKGPRLELIPARINPDTFSPIYKVLPQFSQHYKCKTKGISMAPEWICLGLFFRKAEGAGLE